MTGKSNKGTIVAFFELMINIKRNGFNFIRISIVLCLSSIKPVLFAQNTPLIPVEHFFKIADKGKLDLSPDGKYYSYVSQYENKQNVFIENIETGVAKRVTSYIQNNVRTYYWFNDSLMIIRIDNNGDENYHLNLLNINSLVEKNLTPFKEPFAEDVKIRRDYILANLTNDLGINGFYLINPFDDSLPMLLTTSLNLGDENFVFDNKDVVRIIYGISESGSREMYYRKSEKDSFRLILTTSTENQILPQKFDTNDLEVYCFSNLNRDKFSLVKFNPETVSETQVLYENEDYDVNGEIEYDNEQNKLLYVTFSDWKQQYYFFDKSTEKEYNNYFEKFPEANIDVINKLRDGSVLLKITADINPGEYYIYNHTDRKFKKIADVNTDLNKEYLAKMIPIEYKTQDGMVIHGYLTVPKNRELSNLPTVVFAHGGPWTRDEWGYDSYFQFLANRGYLVFYMDFRGSRGYGKKHYALSFKAWDKMNDDIADGVQWLIKNGISDKSKIAISGVSWGGFASNYGMVFYPELYKCGVTVVGPSNMFSFYDRLVGNLGPSYLGIMDNIIGNPKTDSIYFRKISPLLHIEQLKNPMLIWQGRRDPRVPWQEAQQMFDSALKRGIDVELILKEDEGHNISNVRNRIEFYEKVELFLRKHLQ